MSETFPSPLDRRISARFFVSQIIEHGNVNQITVKMTPAYGEGQNKDYAKATPSGAFELNIDADLPAAEFFREALKQNRKGNFTNIGIEMFAVKRGE